jgi:hypothetical protein
LDYQRDDKGDLVFNELTKEEILKVIKKGDCIERLRRNKDFKVYREVFKDFEKIAKDRLPYIDANDKGELMKWQLLARIEETSDKVLTSIIQEGKLAHEEAKNREKANSG